MLKLKGWSQEALTGLYCECALLLQLRCPAFAFSLSCWLLQEDSGAWLTAGL